ncbi:hypothetical protein JJB98_12245 [Bradyrhizobium diazoefficiens]|nr:hypothetical protein JJB98_12245 [Bradyrhizobium diazoefficiens]
MLISWDTAHGDGSVLLAGVWKGDLAQDDFMFVDDRHLITPTSADATHVSAVHFVKNEGNEAAPQSPGSTAPQYQASVDENNVQFGSDTADVFQATAKNDLYFGLGGDDRLGRGAGDDHLSGDAGNDLLDGGQGRDGLRGADGDDHIYGGGMNDDLMGARQRLPQCRSRARYVGRRTRQRYLQRWGRSRRLHGFAR